MKVYILEHRLINDLHEFENVVAFVGSSLEKIEEFICTNKNYENDKYVWWWGIYEEEIDNMNSTGGDIIFYDKDGNKIQEQPCSIKDN